MRFAIFLLLTGGILLPGCPGPVNTVTLAQATLQLRGNFNAADADHDGLLTLDEARAQVPALSTEQFNTLDVDSSGFLSPDEVGLSVAEGEGEGETEGEGEGEGEGEPFVPAFYTYTVVDTFPHDTAAFTQGLVYANGTLYEGTGLVDRSSLRRVDLETGIVEMQLDIPSPYFGEGIDFWNGRIVQLTWRNQRGFIYQADTFEQVYEFRYQTEGWGITHDDDEYIMSNGTNVLRFLHPDTLEVVRQVAVYDRGEAIQRLNELEYIHGEVWANVWQTDLIARINPDTGVVVGWIDLSGLLTESQRQRTDVLNGIAYDAENDRILATGKLWPSIFHVSIVPFE